VSWSLSGILCGLSALGSPSALNAQSAAIGLVKATALHVRSQPDTDARILHILERGAHVKILSHENGWYKILHRNTVGYIGSKDRYVEIISTNTDGSISQFKETAQDISRRIETSRAHLLSVTREEAQTINGLDKLDLSLNSTQKQVKRLKAELNRLVGETRASEKAVEALSEKIGISGEYAAERLVALYKLSWMGKTPIIAATESIYDILLRKKAIEGILAKDEERLNSLWLDRKRLQELIERQSTHISRKHSIEADLGSQVEKLSHKRATRAKLLAAIRTEKRLEMAAIDALSQAAAALDDTIKSLGLASAQIDEAEPGEKESHKSFSVLKGLLNMPVKGKVANAFGPYRDMQFNVENFRSGIDITADRGEPIRAIYGGKVLYAKWFKGYGNVVIIDHGENYYTIYAHIEEVFKSKDETVEEGEVVATVGDTGSRTGSKLYFELRHHGKPLDPLLWIKKS